MFTYNTSDTKCGFFFHPTTSSPTFWSPTGCLRTQFYSDTDYPGVSPDPAGSGLRSQDRPHSRRRFQVWATHTSDQAAIKSGVPLSPQS